MQAGAGAFLQGELPVGPDVVALNAGGEIGADPVVLGAVVYMQLYAHDRTACINMHQVFQGVFHNLGGTPGRMAGHFKRQLPLRL